MSLTIQLMNSLWEYLSSPLVFSGVCVTRSLVLCVCFVDRCVSFCTFFFWPLCCMFFFDIYGFWLLLWYLQALLIIRFSFDIIILSCSYASYMKPPIGIAERYIINQNLLLYVHFVRLPCSHTPELSSIVTKMA